MNRRETIIALRARRASLRVAREIAYPELPEAKRVVLADAPPDDPAPTLDPEGVEALKTLLIACAIIVSALALFLITYALVYDHF